MDSKGFESLGKVLLNNNISAKKKFGQNFLHDKNIINQIVIGYPIGLNNSENRMTNLVNNFIEDLLNLNVQIHKIDERLSSKLFKNNESDRIDDLSALEILESYIAQNE